MGVRVNSVIIRMNCPGFTLKWDPPAVFSNMFKQGIWVVLDLVDQDPSYEL